MKRNTGISMRPGALSEVADAAGVDYVVNLARYDRAQWLAVLPALRARFGAALAEVERAKRKRDDLEEAIRAIERATTVDT